MKPARLTLAALLAPLALTACSDGSGRTTQALEELHQGVTDALQDAAVAWDGLRELTAAQKDVFLEQAADQLENLDIELERLREEALEKGGELAEASRLKLEELERKREELGPKLDQLEQSGDAAFDELRDGFIAALEAFQATAAEPASDPVSEPASEPTSGR